jgi:hypothetical protein
MPQADKARPRAKHSEFEGVIKFQSSILVLKVWAFVTETNGATTGSFPESLIQ